jgi:hypothetical protein
MAHEKIVSQEYPALDVIKEAMREPDNWEARHADIAGGTWTISHYWRNWRTCGLLGTTMRRVETIPQPTEAEILRGEIKALTAALEQEREKRKELEARAERIASASYNIQSGGSAILHMVEANRCHVCSLPIPRGTYRVLLEKVGE